jgi:hypothetical protein
MAAKMLEDPQIQKLMKQIAADIVPPGALLEVSSQSANDEYGEQSLRITLVFADAAAGQLSGKQLSDMFHELRVTLLREGDERFPHIHFTTPADSTSDDEEV